MSISNNLILLMAAINIAGALIVLRRQLIVYKVVITIAWLAAGYLQTQGELQVAMVCAAAGICFTFLALRSEEKWASTAEGPESYDPYERKPRLKEAVRRLKARELPQARDEIVAHLNEVPGDPDALALLRACDRADEER